MVVYSNQQNLIISCSNQKKIIKLIFGTGIISLSEQCSAASGGYHMIPFRTIRLYQIRAHRVGAYK